jgi:hypothetical protein
VLWSMALPALADVCMLHLTLPETARCCADGWHVLLTVLNTQEWVCRHPARVMLCELRVRLAVLTLLNAPAG